MGVIVSFVARLVTVVYQLPLQFIGTILFNVFLCLREIVPMLGMALYGIIVIPFALILALKGKFLSNYCSLIFNFNSVKSFILSLGFLSLLVFVVIFLIVIAPILWVIFTSALLCSFILGTISPRQTAILIDPLFQYLDLHWYHNYLIQYSSSHSNLDHSILNLIIFPCIIVLNMFVMIFVCLTVPFTVPYEVVREIKDMTELMFVKVNTLSYAYLRYKSAGETSDLTTLSFIPDGYSAVYTDMQKARPASEQHDEKPCDGMSLVVPRRNIKQDKNEPKTPYFS